MKRIGNLFETVYSIGNLYKADNLAQRGKAKQFGVVLHNSTQDENLLKLQTMLVNKTYQTSDYKVFKVYEPKEREVYRLPYFPDRITHYAIMNVLEPIFMSVFTADTYSCIKGKGIHSALRNLKEALKDVEGTTYCLKFDITKFYPSVDHDILKVLLRKKFKDNDLLWLLDEIIDSAPGLPIGNYLSQFFANFYLTYFDHWLKEQKGVKYYFRYADDIVILSDNKLKLHILLSECRQYLSQNLKLQIKPDYQIFPVKARGIDFVGYKCFHTHTLLRKSIKKRFAKAIKAGKGKETLASYLGWAKHADTINLLTKLLNEPVQRI
ncbi:reverse transcriptase/maturase family protein [Emticicia sp. BO119]|uniref:reverse transcriptase/maturase family protein n=1 Tax=Emticicia sp. BO119 TaxID=2757768 RepID=UPI0015F04344|nr:reverse transcriptase/maturase family protein [Emticicia sp. BO119]MBA4849464.1 reverse transcriptase [Emticicia sp. BO119]